MQANDRLGRISASGVSIWLDDLSRDRLRTGELAELVRDRHVVGVTTNPTIFAGALADGDAYADQVRDLAARGVDVEEAAIALTSDDVRAAADVLAPLYPTSDYQDGRVSIEVDPRLARDTEATIAQARRLWSLVDRPNVYVKIPATEQGLPAITAAIAEGISVNVTLIFSLDRYRAVAQAYVDGLEKAQLAGLDLSRIASVASVFLSRIDAKVDPALDEIGGEEAARLRGGAAIAGARLAYQAFEEIFSTPRWEDLASAGGRVQRPLWASTGRKDPSYPDTRYVDELVVDRVVNTMPEKTLLAVADHARLPEGDGVVDTVRGTAVASREVLDEIVRLGVPYERLLAELEDEGVEKFVTSWEELLGTVATELDGARAAGA